MAACWGWGCLGGGPGPREGKPYPFLECSAHAWAGRATGGSDWGLSPVVSLGNFGAWTFLSRHPQANPGCWGRVPVAGLGSPTVGLLGSSTSSPHPRHKIFHRLSANPVWNRPRCRVTHSHVMDTHDGPDVQAQARDSSSQPL